MTRKTKHLLFSLLLLIILVLSIICMFRTEMVVLTPKGSIGIEQRNLLVVATLLMLIVVIPVLVLTFWIAWRYREGNKKASYTPDWGHSTLAEVIWWGIPCIIIVILGAINWISSYNLDPYKPIQSNKKTMTIQVIALNWKWLFIYPEQNIASINFIQFPEKTPIHFEITSDAPMNSFWIPELGGQIFAMPGMKTELYLIADEMGEFRGVSANLSGKGFSGMKFTAKASSEEDFEKWVREVKNTGKPLSMKTYNALVEPSENNKVAYYVLKDRVLFDWIVMKDMIPPKQGVKHDNK